MHTETMVPVIKKALGSQWDTLHPVVRQHYDLTPGTEQAVIMKGIMREIHHSAIAKLFLLPGRLFGALIPYRGENIPARVRNWTTTNDVRTMFWQRSFSFPNGKTAIFASRMVHVAGDEIIEYVRFGLGIRMRVSADRGSLIYRSTCYQWDIGALSIRLPTWLILGAGEIRESGTSDSGFEMDFQMRHPLFGRTFSYSGAFEMEPSR